MKAATIESLADALDALGVPCIPVERRAAPNRVLYFFNFQKITDLHKIRRIIPILRRILRNEDIKAEYLPESDFTISIPRDTPEMLPFSEAYASIKGDFIIGKNDGGGIVSARLDELPHLLIAGTTGSGKSVLENDIICSLACQYAPERLNLLLIDPKSVEFTPYNSLPHLVSDVISDAAKAVDALQWAASEMDRRYKELERIGKRSNSGEFPRLVIVIDELADLMLTGGYNAEKNIVRIAQKGRAAGVHLIIATQRPTVNIITGLIKANIPSRIAFRLPAVVDSRTILDHKGAEALRGRGDGLALIPSISLAPFRFQAPFLSSDDIKSIIE